MGNPIEPKTPPQRGYRVSRGVETLKKCIRRNPKYKNMRPNIDEVVKDFLATKNCWICYRGFLTPKKRHCLRDAIDHNHDLEKTEECCYRGRLCDDCNKAEGIGKRAARSSKTKSTHAELVARYRKVTPRRIDKYLRRRPVK